MVVGGAAVAVLDVVIVLTQNERVFLDTYAAIIGLDGAVLLALVVDTQDAPVWAYTSLTVALFLEVVVLSVIRGPHDNHARYTIAAVTGAVGIAATGGAIGGLLLSGPEAPARLLPWRKVPASDGT